MSGQFFHVKEMKKTFFLCLSDSMLANVNVPICKETVQNVTEKITLDKWINSNMRSMGKLKTIPRSI